MKYFKEDNAETALEALNKELKRGYPCILSVSNWEHWITVMGYQKNKYIIVDSGMDKVINILTPKQLLKRWKFEYEGEISFDGYAIIPLFKVNTLAVFTLEKAKKVMYNRHSQLAQKWDSYFNDLINICRPRTPLSFNIMSFNEFLRRHENILVKKVSFWHGNPNINELKKLLRNMQFVAEVYDLVIYEEDEKRAIIDLASILMMYACGKYGMEPIYS